MTFALGENTQAILLLTAPLIAGRGKSTVRPLATGEYNRLARELRSLGHEPADLLHSDVREVLAGCSSELDRDRLAALLGRGFRLGQAVDRWTTRAIWITSRAEADYPQRLKTRLQDQAPPVLYGCGDRGILDGGGLAVVGSRNASDILVEYTEAVGRLAAEAGRTLVSGGARGVDQAAMRGALDAGGGAVGVLADGLEKAAMRREHREPLMDKRLALISPYDPAARFNAGNAMSRNKLVYALADAALVVDSDYGKGGTWAGAVEQLDKYRFVPVHVRMSGDVGKGLRELQSRGAHPWPAPSTPEDLERILDRPPDETVAASPKPLSFPFPEDRDRTPARAPAEGRRAEAATPAVAPGEPAPVDSSQVDSSPAEALFAKVKALVLRYAAAPRTDVEVAEALGVGKGQARIWLKRLVAEGALERLSGPVRYRAAGAEGSLFDPVRRT